jgi:hypothetical protein
MNFGFVVIRVQEKNPNTNEYEKGDMWRVCLPHQCDSWMIAGEQWDGVSHDEAVQQLKGFIAEAEAALKALENKQEQGED